MQYVWQHRLWLQRDMVTVDGRRVEVIDQGRLNVDSGLTFSMRRCALTVRCGPGMLRYTCVPVTGGVMAMILTVRMIRWCCTLWVWMMPR